MFCLPKTAWPPTSLFLEAVGEELARLRAARAAAAGVDENAVA